MKFLISITTLFFLTLSVNSQGTLYKGSFTGNGGVGPVVGQTGLTNISLTGINPGSTASGNIVSNQAGTLVLVPSPIGGGGGSSSNYLFDPFWFLVTTNTGIIDVTMSNGPDGDLLQYDPSSGALTKTNTIYGHIAGNIYPSLDNAGIVNASNYLSIANYFYMAYLTTSGWLDSSNNYGGTATGRFSWSLNYADFLGKHYLGNTFYTIQGDTTAANIITPTFGSRYQTNFSGANVTFGNPINLENSALTPSGWNELNVLVSNSSGSAITVSFPNTWSNFWSSNAIPVSVPTHSMMIFKVEVVPAFATNVSWQSPPGSGGGVTTVPTPDGSTIVSNAYQVFSTATNIIHATVTTTTGMTNNHNRIFIGTFYTNYEGDTGWTNVSFGNTNIYANGFQNLTNATGSGQLGASTFGFTNGTSFIFWDGTRLNIGGAYNFAPTGFTNLTAALTFYNFGNNSTLTASNGTFSGSVTANSVTGLNGVFGQLLYANAITNVLDAHTYFTDGAGTQTGTVVGWTNFQWNIASNWNCVVSNTTGICFSNIQGLKPGVMNTALICLEFTNQYPAGTIQHTYLSWVNGGTSNTTPSIFGWVNGESVDFSTATPYNQYLNFQVFIWGTNWMSPQAVWICSQMGNMTFGNQISSTTAGVNGIQFNGNAQGGNGFQLTAPNGFITLSSGNYITTINGTEDWFKVGGTFVGKFNQDFVAPGVSYSLELTGNLNASGSAAGKAVITNFNLGWFQGTVTATNGFSSFGTNILIAGSPTSTAGQFSTIANGWTNPGPAIMMASVTGSAGNLVFYQRGGSGGGTAASTPVSTNGIVTNCVPFAVGVNQGFQIVGGTAIQSTVFSP